MDKNSVVLILNECFSIEGNYALLHFLDGSELLIDNKPSFVNLFFHVKLKYKFSNNEIVSEDYKIPYSSILYICITNKDNLSILSKEHFNKSMEQYDFLKDV